MPYSRITLCRNLRTNPLLCRKRKDIDIHALVMETSTDTPPSTFAVVAEVKKEFEFLGPQTFVTIHIGTDANKEETFMVQKSLICHHFPFFDAAFHSLFIEGQTQSMTGEDVDSEVFALLLRWLYEQRIWQGVDGRVAAVDLAKL
ncbi:hypothetical protein BDZ45DRAFT_698981 [Acephala macrosclerotiorum]|nr:hypothetical protein BDZ45DRAFT_698981 [Acephala macrosclerotiorum]